MINPQSLDEYIQKRFGWWLKLSKEHFGRVIDPREGGKHIIREEPDKIYTFKTIGLPEFMQNLDEFLVSRDFSNNHDNRLMDFGSNYRIDIFSKTPDFYHVFCRELKENFDGKGFKVAEAPIRGKPYPRYGHGYSYEIDLNNEGIGHVFLLEEDEKRLPHNENNTFLMWHGNEISCVKFAKVVAETVMGKYAAHFNVFQPNRTVAGIFYDPDWKK